jgi:hypothetical protein
MLYSHLDIWEAQDGQLWHALYRPGTRDLSMGAMSPKSIDKTIDWAKMHHMTIIDKRKPAVTESGNSH